MIRKFLNKVCKTAMGLSFATMFVVTMFGIWGPPHSDLTVEIFMTAFFTALFSAGVGLFTC